MVIRLKYEKSLCLVGPRYNKLFHDFATNSPLLILIHRRFDHLRGWKLNSDISASCRKNERTSFCDQSARENPRPGGFDRGQQRRRHCLNFITHSCRVVFVVRGRDGTFYLSLGMLITTFQPAKRWSCSASEHSLLVKHTLVTGSDQMVRGLFQLGYSLHCKIFRDAVADVSARCW